MLEKESLHEHVRLSPVLEFDFVPSANQVVFQYSFASDEYPEWVNTPFNDVFACYVNGTNYATVRQVAGDPNSPFVPVAVNNINDGNPYDPAFVPARPDLFRPNYVDPNGGPSAIDLELDGITRGLNFVDIVGATGTTYADVATVADDGHLFQAVFTNDEGVAVTTAALLAVAPATPVDLTAPDAPVVALAQDSGSSDMDNITSVGWLSLSGVEEGATVEYSADGGNSWSNGFSAIEGLNTVQVRQTDLAGNVSGVATLSFTLDTTPPQLNPAFSTGTQLILVNAKGVAVSPNATDASGIASQSAGAVNTTTAGKKSVTCTATDLAGNSASVSVSYVAGYAAANITPQSGATFKKTSTIPISFQLRDANGLLSDTVAASLASKVAITFDDQTFGGVVYNKKTHAFSLNLKVSNPTVGAHTLGIHVVVSGIDVTTVYVPLKIV